MLGLLLVAVTPVASAQPTLEADSELATAGYFTLSWSDGAGNYELQQSGPDSTLAIKLIYSGPDEARVVSGLADGRYQYRVRYLADEVQSDWSEPVSVIVAHHSLAKAWLFFTVGLVVFVALLAAIWLGNRRMSAR